MDPYIAKLASQDPIAAEAVDELSSFAADGDFLILSASVDKEKLAKIFANGSGYWLGQVGIFNAQRNLSENPDLAVITFVTTTDVKARLAFLRLYQQLVVPWQLALEIARADEANTNGAESIAMLTAFEEKSLLETTARLATEGKRLIGGFAVIVNTNKPDEYIGVTYTSREFAQQYQFNMREAALQSDELEGLDENERRKIITLEDNQTGNEIINNQIMYNLATEEDVAKTLFPNGISYQSPISSPQAELKTEEKLYPPPNYRKNSINDKNRRRASKKARRSNRKRK